MGFSTIFIRRPIATSLLMAGLLLLGILGYRQLPVSALPEIDAPSLVVTTQYPGANATTMASLVTTPLERQFGQISGLEIMTSDSSAGLSTIILQFSMDRDIDIAAQDVQAAIRQATLPSSLPYQPVYNRVNPADAAIVTLKLTSDTRPLRDVNNYADSILAQRLSQVQGVGLVSIAGNVRPAVRIQVNPAQLSNMGLTLEELRSALTQANVNAPKGSLNGKTQSYSIGTNDQLTSAAEYRDTIISYKNGRPVRLSDVANVVDGVENDQLAAWADGKPAVLLEVRRQPGANIVQTVERIRALLPQLQNVLPADVHLEIFSDRTETIRASVHEVQFTLILTICLVVAVIFVFLRRLWATIIPSVAVPLSLAGTFGVMAFAGMSLDNLSLMALVVATGFVVDDAIVMIENIVRYIEQGKSGPEAAEIGARQIGFTVLSLTVSLVAVFLPLLLMPGVTGRLFHEFAWVLSIAVALSMLISLTLTPMMCAYLLKPDALPEGEDAHERAAAAGKQNLWTRTVGLYERSLDWVLDHQPLTLAVAAGALVLTVVLYMVIPKGLLPEQDTGLITGVVQADQNIAFPQMEQRTKAVAEALRKDPAVTGVSAFIGAGSMNPTLNQGQLSIVLKERGDRDGLDEILPRLQKAVAGIPGVALYLKPVQDVTLDTRVAATEYQYSLSDVDSARGRAAGHAPDRSAAPAPGAGRRGQQPVQPGPRAGAEHRPRQGQRAGRADADHRRHAVRRLRPAPDLHHLHRAQPVPRGAGSGAGVPHQHRADEPAGGGLQRRRRADRQQRHQLRPGHLVQLVHRHRHRRAEHRHPGRRRQHHPAGRAGRGQGHQHAAGGQPPAAAAGGDGVVQRRPGLFAVRCGQGHRRDQGQPGHALAGACAVHRQGRRVHRQPDRRGVAAAGLAGGDLHRAGRAVRELHPPVHDHLDPAAGRRRCAAGADGVRAAACRWTASSASCC